MGSSSSSSSTSAATTWRCSRPTYAFKNDCDCKHERGHSYNVHTRGARAAYAARLRNVRQATETAQVSHIRINDSTRFVSRAFRNFGSTVVNIHVYVEHTSDDDGSVKLDDTGFSGVRIRLYRSVLQSFKVA